MGSNKDEEKINLAFRLWNNPKKQFCTKIDAKLLIAPYFQARLHFYDQCSSHDPEKRILIDLSDQKNIDLNAVKSYFKMVDLFILYSAGRSVSERSFIVIPDNNVTLSGLTLAEFFMHDELINVCEIPLETSQSHELTILPDRILGLIIDCYIDELCKAILSYITFGWKDIVQLFYGFYPSIGKLIWQNTQNRQTLVYGILNIPVKRRKMLMECDDFDSMIDVIEGRCGAKINISQAMMDFINANPEYKKLKQMEKELLEIPCIKCGSGRFVLYLRNHEIMDQLDKLKNKIYRLNLKLQNDYRSGKNKIAMRNRTIKAEWYV